MREERGLTRADTTDRARDRGSTLIELIVAIALMGIIVIPILTSIQTAVRSSSVSREAAEIETLIVNVADRVNRAPMTCDSLNPYRQYVAAAIRTHGWDPDDANVLAPLTYFHYDSGAWAPGATFAEGDGVGLRCVQKVRITIGSPQHDIHRTVEVVKSDV